MRDGLEPETPARPSPPSWSRTIAERAELVTEAAELVVCHPETAAVLCDAYLFEPDAGERPLGSLALVAETLNVARGPGEPPPPESDRRSGPRPTRRETFSADEEDAPAAPVLHSPRGILETVASAVRKEYYREPNRDTYTSFESALSAANAVLTRVAERGDTDWLTNLHVAAAAYQGTTIHVSLVGSASLFLVRSGRLTDIGEGLADPRIRNPRALFTNVASGTVGEQDVIVLASPNLFRLIPKDRCSSLLTGKHPKEAVTYTRDLLIDAADSSPVAAVFLRFVKAPIVLPPPPVPASDQRPTVFVPPAVATVRPSHGFGERPALRPRLPLQRGRWQRVRALVPGLVTVVLIPALQRGVAGAGGLLRLGARTARRTVARTARTTPTPPSPPPLRSVAARLPTRELTRAVREAPERLRQTMTSWPRSTKTFFVLTILLALLFLTSVVFLRRKTIKDAAVRSASEKLQEARVKKEAAEAALIYENVNEARRFLREARTGAEAVKQSAFYAAETTELFETLQAIEDRTELIVRIPEPARVGDFGAVAADRRVAGLAAAGTSLFAFHPETNGIFRLSSENGEVKTVSQTSQGIGYFRQVTVLPREQMLLLATDAPGLALFDTTKGELLKQELTPLPEGAREIRSLATFGSRLYVLLPEQKQILGYSKTLAGYTGGSPWMKEASVPVEKAISLGVDGYIYLLLNDGKILKLLKGAPVDFKQSELSTPLERPTRLVINETLKHLYVLDPPRKRVVVYDTTGKLTRQFVFQNAQDLRDITVGGKEETLYALDGTAVYRVPLK